MKKPVVVVGIGEMGGVFARAFLNDGHPVYPVTEDMNMADASQELPDPELVVIAVDESASPEVLPNIPEVWRDRLVLIQNELLPPDWKQHNLEPTVISVWFEKKKGQDVKQVTSSPVHGKNAKAVAAALETLGLDTRVLSSASDLQFELVVKNVYILTTNIAGLVAGGNTVTELWSSNETLARNVASEVIEVQEKLLDTKLKPEPIIDAMAKAFEADPEHKCLGRRPQIRLERLLKFAAEHELELPTIERINDKAGHGGGSSESES